MLLRTYFVPLPVTVHVLRVQPLHPSLYSHSYAENYELGESIRILILRHGFLSLNLR